MTQQPVGAVPRPRPRTVPILLATALGSTALAAVSPNAAAPDDGHDDARHRSHHTSSRSALHPVASAPVVRVLAAPVRGPVQSTYRVKAGDTVSHIALATGSTTSAIIAANGLSKNGFIREGQTLVLPSRGGGGGPTATGRSGRSAPAAGAYTVRAGDTVSHIAARYGTTVAAIVAANGLSANGFIREGQRLSVPGAARKSVPKGTSGATIAARGASAPSAPTVGTYTVKAGDTLSHIAARTGNTVSALRAANPSLDKSATIQIGQKLAVPGATSSSSKPLANTFAGRTYSDAVVRSATANRDALAARSVPTRAQMQAMVAETARRHGVDPALAQAIAYQESGFNMRAVSPANAVGVMQVIPSSGQWASDMVGRRLDLLDPQDNVTAGVLLLRAHTRSGADQATVIAAYYQGMAGVKRNGMYPDTRRYVASVQTLMARYR